MNLIKNYLGMLAFADNPTPAGRAACFISSVGSKYYVSFFTSNYNINITLAANTTLCDELVFSR